MGTTSNTQISSFGYDTKRDRNAMSMFAMLQKNNKKEIDSVLNGTANDIQVEFKLNVDNEINDDESKEEYIIDQTSELQKSLQDQRSDDEGGTLADELDGFISL